jgi:hypothetical protein
MLVAYQKHRMSRNIGLNFLLLFFAARKIAYLMRLPTDEHRLKVGISWFTKSAIDSVSLLQSTLSKVLSGSTTHSD